MVSASARTDRALIDASLAMQEASISKAHIGCLKRVVAARLLVQSQGFVEQGFGFLIAIEMDKDGCVGHQSAGDSRAITPKHLLAQGETFFGCKQRGIPIAQLALDRGQHRQGVCQ